MQYNKSIY